MPERIGGALCLCWMMKWVEDFPNAEANRILEVPKETQTVELFCYGPLEEEKTWAITMRRS